MRSFLPLKEVQVFCHRLTIEVSIKVHKIISIEYLEIHHCKELLKTLHSSLLDSSLRMALLERVILDSFLLQFSCETQNDLSLLQVRAKQTWPNQRVRQAVNTAIKFI